jgi:hypothetical protein
VGQQTRGAIGGFDALDRLFKFDFTSQIGKQTGGRADLQERKPPGGIQRIADDVIAYVRPAIRMSKTPNFRCGAMPATIQFSPVKLKNARKK